MTIDLHNITQVKDSQGTDIIRMYGNRNNIIWEKQPGEPIYDETDYKNQYFTITPSEEFFTQREDGQEQWHFEIHGEPESKYYRIDNGEWIQDTSSGAAITLNGFHKVYIKATHGELRPLSGDDLYTENRVEGIRIWNNTVGNDTEEITYKVSGNILSLVYGDNFRNTNDIYIAHLFEVMFGSQYNLTDASNLILPSGRLSMWCFADMFIDCKQLKGAPRLDSTTLAYGCYSQMFYMCSGLTKAPLLPAIDIPEEAYRRMFERCSSLKYVEVYAETYNNYSFNYWLNNVSNVGTLVKKSVLNLTGFNAAPNNWEIINL